MYYDLAQYMVSKRKDKQDKFIDSDLAMLYATCIHFNNHLDDAKIRLSALL